MDPYGGARKAAGPPSSPWLSTAESDSLDATVGLSNLKELALAREYLGRTSRNPFTLSFSGQWERDFAAFFHTKVRGMLRVTVALLVPLFLLLLIADLTDNQTSDGTKLAVALLRSMVSVVWLVFGAFTFVPERILVPALQPALGLTALLSGSGLLALAAVRGSDNGVAARENYLVQYEPQLAMLTFTTVLVCTWLRFALLLPISLVLVLVYIGLAVGQLDESVGEAAEDGAASQIVEMCTVLITGVCILSTAAYLIEYYARRDFVFRKMLQDERRSSERLLARMVPESIIPNLMTGNKVFAEEFENATVLFCEVVGIEEAAQDSIELVKTLDRVFGRLDRDTDFMDLFKVETVGSTYMAAAGLPNVVDGMHARRAALLALRMKDTIEAERLNGRPLECRIGLNSGPVIAGVIGLQLPRYRLFGDTINTASRMMTTAPPGSIQVSQSVAIALDYQFDLEPRGPIEVKGKGAMNTFLLGPEVVRDETGDLSSPRSSILSWLPETPRPKKHVTVKPFSGVDAKYGIRDKVKRASSKVSSVMGPSKLNLSFVSLLEAQTRFDRLEFSSDRAQQDKVTLRFKDNQVEHDFHMYFARITLRPVRFAAALAVLFTIVFAVTALWDGYDRDDDDDEELAGAMRLVGAMLSLAFFAFTYHPLFIKYHQRSIFAALATVGLALGGVRIVEGLVAIDVFALYIIFVFNLSQLRFIRALILCLLSLVFYFATLAERGENAVSQRTWFNYSAFAVFLISLNTMAARNVERFTRADFLAKRVLGDEKERIDTIIGNMVPRAIAGRLRLLSNKTVEPGTIADTHDNIVVMVTDMVGFTKMANSMCNRGSDLVELLNYMYIVFDMLIASHSMYKVETIGDSYVVAGGIGTDEPCADPVRAMVHCAFDLIQAAALFEDPSGKPLQIRVGIHVGSVVAGVVGHAMPRYHIWGRCSSVAGELERLGQPGMVHVSKDIKEILGGEYGYRPSRKVKSAFFLLPRILEPSHQLTAAEEFVRKGGVTSPFGADEPGVALGAVSPTMVIDQFGRALRGGVRGF